MRFSKATFLSLLALQPVFVIEFPELTEHAILSKATERRVSQKVYERIKNAPICSERFEISQPVIYLLEPSETQAYLSRNMDQAHCHILRKDVPAMKAAVARANKRVQGQNTTRLVEVKMEDDRYDDEYLKVRNNIPEHLLKRIDRDLVKEKLATRKADPNRNNICFDLGFCGSRNSKRDPDFMGLTHSNVHDGTKEQWAKDLLAATTSVMDELFPEVSDQIYNDTERNECFAKTIDPSSRIESLRMAASSQTQLVWRHRDDQNCKTLGYAWVFNLSWMLFNVEGDNLDRHSLITYGKNFVNTCMEQRKKHRCAIDVLTRLYGSVPEVMKKRDSSVFPSEGSDRKAYPFAFLDKTIFYSLFASAISRVFDKYCGLRANLLMACALLYNVVMCECPDHFWHICDDLVEDPTFLTPSGLYGCDPYVFAHEFAMEIFHRKRRSKKSKPRKKATYPTQQRHMPAVCSPPTFEQTKKSVAFIATLVNELGQLVDWNIANVLHYYGRTVEHLVQSSFGAGHLTAMHIIGTGSCLGLFPQGFLEVAEMGKTTRTWLFFKWAFGYSDINAYQETNTLMRAVAVALRIPIMQVEELCCLLCKLLSPRRRGYQRRQCRIDFGKCTFDFKKLKFGDVVYRDMILFSVSQHGSLYGLDRDGKKIPRHALLREDCFGQVVYQPIAEFWSMKCGRTFHYKRHHNSVKVTNIKHYFISPDQERFDVAEEGAYSSVVPDSPDYYWTLKGPYAAAETTAKRLLGPSYESVLLGWKGREPLNMRDIVWQTIYKDGTAFKKSMFHFEVLDQALYRPPVVAEKYMTIRRQAFFCCAIVLPSDFSPVKSCEDNVYWPDPYFDMYPVGKGDELKPVPYDWEVSTLDVEDPTDPRWKHSEERLEANYIWNYSRVLPSNDYRMQRRWFASKDMARKHCLFSFFFNNLPLFDQTHPQVRSLLYLENLTTKGPYKKSTMDKQRIVVDGTEEVHVYYDPMVKDSKKLRTPFMVSVLYPRGGLAYYLCNDAGIRVSGAYLRRPPPRTRRADKPGITYEFIGIVNHVSGPNRKHKHRGSSVNLLIKWKGGTVTEEPQRTILEDSPMEVVNYAVDNNLLDHPGWARVKALKNSLDSKSRESTVPIPRPKKKPKRGSKKVRFLL